MRRITRLDEQVEEIVEQYGSGKSMQQIAIDFDVSLNAIRTRLLENGVETRISINRYEWLDTKIPEIIHAYIVGRESLKTIGERYGTSPAPIKMRLQEAGVELRPWTLEFSDRQRSIIEGELLGDGCIYERQPGSCHFKLETTTREHAAYLTRELPEGFFPEKHPYNHERTTELGNGPSTRWIVYSRMQQLMAEIHETWYEKHNGRHRKVVPPGYCLNQTAILHWYWGDGSVGHRESGAPRVMFSTQGFPEASILRLQEELETMGYENYSVPHNHVENGSGLEIRLTDGASRDFLREFVESNVIDDYAYKFVLDGSR